MPFTKTGLYVAVDKTPELSPDELTKSQLQAIAHLINTPRGGLFHEPGAGKTIVSLSAYVERKRALGTTKPMLVIAPKRVSTMVWAQEIVKWEHTCHLRCINLTGTPAQRIFKLGHEADVYLLGVDLTAWLCETITLEGFSVIVVDECTKFKRIDSLRSRQFKLAMSEHSEQDLAIWGLTGTPTAEHYLDLYGQMSLIGKEEDLGRDKSSFQYRFFQEGFTAKGSRFFTLRKDAGKKIASITSRYFHRYDAGSLLGVPELLEQKIWITPETKAQKVLKTRGENFAEGVRKLRKKGVSTGFQSLWQSFSLQSAQIANGFSYDYVHGVEPKEHEDCERPWYPIHEGKMEAFKDLVEELQGNQMLVAYNFVADMCRMTTYLTSAGIPYAVLRGRRNTRQEEEIMEAWDTKKIQILIAPYLSASYGLNLQTSNCCHVCHFGLPWRNELYLQYNKRVARQGNTSSQVFVHLLLLRDTLDGAQYDKLKAKKTASETFNRVVQQLTGEKEMREIDLTATGNFEQREPVSTIESKADSESRERADRSKAILQEALGQPPRSEPEAPTLSVSRDVQVPPEVPVPSPAPSPPESREVSAPEAPPKTRRRGRPPSQKKQVAASEANGVSANISSPASMAKEESIDLSGLVELAHKKRVVLKIEVTPLHE